MVHLGQINAPSTLKLTTNLNRLVTGLSDVLIDIYRPDDVKIVTNGVMTEIGTTGIYVFSFGIPAILGGYTVLISCASQRNYKEVQSFNAVKPSGAGGGMVVQYPVKVIDKKEEKRRKEQKELMIAIDTKLTALIKKNPEIDFTEVNKEIKKRTKELEDNMKKLLKKKEELSNDGLEKINLQNKKDKKEFIQNVADFTDKIYQLQENTKLLPNSLNSLLTSAETAQESRLSKMQDLIKNKFDDINTQTSKFSNEAINSSEKLSERFDEKFNQVENKLVSQIDTIPKIITIKTENIKKEIMELDKKFKDNVDSTNNSFLDYKKSSDDNIKEVMVSMGAMAKTLSNNLDSLDIKGNTTLNDNIKNIQKNLINVIEITKEIENKNNQGFKKVENILTKIPTRRDLTYTQEVTLEKIKEAQSNNTKKIKILRDNIETVSKEVKESKETQITNKKEIVKKIELAEEESNLNAQLDLLNAGQDAQ